MAERCNARHHNARCELAKGHLGDHRYKQTKWKQEPKRRPRPNHQENWT